jgi:hypothetical protein
MSAAMLLPTVWAAAEGRPGREPAARAAPERRNSGEDRERYAFYRKHTESMLKRYLYASMQVGRAPSLLSQPVVRGWASSSRIRTFEDAVIFVLDMERCLDRLTREQRDLIARIALQEYTQVEAAQLTGMSPRAVAYKFPAALDALTSLLLEARLLTLPGEEEACQGRDR